MEVDVIDLKFQGRGEAIAAFMVSGPEGKILVETGPESTLDTLVESLAVKGVQVSDLSGVFVTHIHLDHAGAAGWFADKGVPVYVHPKGARHLIDPSRLIESARRVYGDQFEPFWGGMTPAPAERVNVIEDGETRTVGGIEVEAMDAPGHAFHQHVFLIGCVGFAGDAAGAGFPESDYISLTSAPPQFHLEHTLGTLDRLEQRKLSGLYLTHFGPLTDVEGHLERYREVVEMNAQFVRERINEGMDADTLRVAYEAFQMEQAFREELPPDRWQTMQIINGTDMCADGIRLYWEKTLNRDT